MPSQRERNNVRAGIFVTLTILLGVFTIITLTDLWTTLTRSTREYTVRFHVADGIASIEPGAKVLVGGVDLGSVVAVEPRFDPDGPFREIDVRFEVDDRVVLFADAKITVASSLIGAEAWLEVTTVGTEGEPQDNRLTGIPPGGLLGSFLSPEVAIRTQEIVTDVAASAESARNITAKIEENIDPAVAEAREAITNARDTTAEIRDSVHDINTNWLPPQLERADSIMAWAETATERVDTVLEEGRLLMTDSREGVAEVRTIVDDAAEPVQRTIDNAEASSADMRAMTERARGEMMDRIDTILASGERALDQAEATIVDARTAVRGWTPVVDDTLADARLSTQQLKLALVEIRRSPWKVLYRPTTDELEHELLYEAARSFAIAAADLKGASQSMERIFEAYPERVAQDAETLNYLREQLADRVDRYDEAQSRLFDVLNIEQ